MLATRRLFYIDRLVLIVHQGYELPSGLIWPSVRAISLNQGDRRGSGGKGSKPDWKWSLEDVTASDIPTEQAMFHSGIQKQRYIPLHGTALSYLTSRGRKEQADVPRTNTIPYHTIPHHPFPANSPKTPHVKRQSHTHTHDPRPNTTSTINL